MLDDYAYASIGGLGLGLAAAVFLLVNGRILGVSGILNGLTTLSGTVATRSENFAFVFGLVAVPGMLAYANNRTETNANESVWILAACGLLVGTGARMANGCTSGHSISGAARFSVRSYAASFTYLLVAALVYWVLHHGLGLEL